MNTTLITILISCVSAFAAAIAATFAYKTFKINQQRYIVMSIQVEKHAWYNRIRHFIEMNADHLKWDDKRYSKRDKVKKGDRTVSTWDKLAKQKYYELIDNALSKQFKGSETMTEMIESVFKDEFKDAYWKK